MLQKGWVQSLAHNCPWLSQLRALFLMSSELRVQWTHSAWWSLRPGKSKAAFYFSEWARTLAAPRGEALPCRSQLAVDAEKVMLKKHEWPRNHLWLSYLCDILVQYLCWKWWVWGWGRTTHRTSVLQACSAPQPRRNNVLVECEHSKWEIRTPGLILWAFYLSWLGTGQLGMVAHTCDPSTLKVETRGLWV
jgi:hypothetical protein